MGGGETTGVEGRAGSIVIAGPAGSLGCMETTCPLRRPQDTVPE